MSSSIEIKEREGGIREKPSEEEEGSHASERDRNGHQFKRIRTLKKINKLAH